MISVNNNTGTTPQSNVIAHVPSKQDLNCLFSKSRIVKVNTKKSKNRLSLITTRINNNSFLFDGLLERINAFPVVTNFTFSKGSFMKENIVLMQKKSFCQTSQQDLFSAPNLLL